MCLAGGRLGFVNLVNREEIPNVITNQSVDLFPLGSYLSTLLGCARFGEIWLFLTEQVFTLPL